MSAFPPSPLSGRAPFLQSLEILDNYDGKSYASRSSPYWSIPFLNFFELETADVRLPQVFSKELFPRLPYGYIDNSMKAKKRRILFFPRFHPYFSSQTSKLSYQRQRKRKTNSLLKSVGSCVHTTTQQDEMSLSNNEVDIIFEHVLLEKMAIYGVTKLRGMRTLQRFMKRPKWFVLLRKLRQQLESLNCRAIKGSLGPFNLSN